MIRFLFFSQRDNAIESFVQRQRLIFCTLSPYFITSKSHAHKRVIKCHHQFHLICLKCTACNKTPPLTQLRVVKCSLDSAIMIHSCGNAAQIKWIFIFFCCCHKSSGTSIRQRLSNDSHHRLRKEKPTTIHLHCVDISNNRFPLQSIANMLFSLHCFTLFAVLH